MTGFVYGRILLSGNNSGKYYIGSHRGSPNDGYIGSGKVFKSAVEKYGINAFARTIFYEGPDFQNKERELLISLNAEHVPMSYNLKMMQLVLLYLGRQMACLIRPTLKLRENKSVKHFGQELDGELKIKNFNIL